MESLKVSKPADGSRVLQCGKESLLIGQPPEVLKGLLLHKVPTFNTMVLTDSKEKDSSDISRIFRLLRLTLLGPTEAELESWGTPKRVQREWLEAAHYLALKDERGQVREVESFFNVIPFINEQAEAGSFTILHTGHDKYTVSFSEDSLEVDLNEDEHIFPPYQMQSDFIPRDLVKLGLEILGSASGFTANEPCTGLALCYNGSYILIDSLPYLDKHLYARGISKNSVSAVFLTHLHVDHCAMFPLILMPQKVEVITTREIFEMAIEKLSCNLN